MQLFQCPACAGSLFFENHNCPCGAAVAYDPVTAGMVMADYPCENRGVIDCNWSAPGGAAEPVLCAACAMTEVIPDRFRAENLALWAEAERAKRWVLATLGRWGWFREADHGPSPVFHMLAETTRKGAVAVTMGHAAGIVTINVAEADAATLVERREALDERFRTMTGHFRHEIGHFIHDRLLALPGFAEEFRDLFGDERADYGEALKVHYSQGPKPGWNEHYVTPYAGSHPHEDWAESFAHLLHLTDIVDSIAASGLSTPKHWLGGYDAYAETDAEALISTAVDLGVALNHVNRAMGLFDLYPFVLAPSVRRKIAFAHRWVRQGAMA